MGGKIRPESIQSDLDIRIEDLDPSKAEALLEQNERLVKAGKFNNRHVSDTRTKRYEDDMKARNWALNGEAIKIGVNGEVLDGQHRLWAVLNSGITIKTVVVYGMDPKLFSTLDQGWGRNGGSILSILRVPSPREVSAALNWLFRYQQKKVNSGTGLGNSLSNPEIERTFFKYPDIVNSIEFGKATKKLMPTSVGIVTHFLLVNHAGQKKATAFFEDLAEGAGLEKGDPVLALREKLRDIKTKFEKRKPTSDEYFALILKAWQFREDGMEVTKRLLVWRKGRDKFPYLDEMTQNRKARRKKAAKAKKAKRKRA